MTSSKTSTSKSRKLKTTHLMRTFCLYKGIGMLKLKEMIDKRKMSKQSHPAPIASAIGPCPTLIPALEVYPASSRHPITSALNCRNSLGLRSENKYKSYQSLVKKKRFIFTVDNITFICFRYALISLLRRK